MRRAPALLAASALAVGVARRWSLRAGATDAETREALPGDELITHASLSATRATDVTAPADDVWPWIAQIGQGRGGFYSYTVLENLVGCDMRNADRIVPEWQHVAVGDEVRLHPEVALRVAALDPGRSLVLRGGIPMGAVAAPYDFTWAFLVRPAADRTARLLVRERYGYTRWWSGLLVEPVEVVSLVMSLRMLRGIKRRAELGAGAVGAP